MTKPVMKNATVIVVDDPTIGGQGLLAVGKDGAFFAVCPGSSVIVLELPKLRTYLDANRSQFGATAEIMLAALDEIEREAS